MCDVKQNEELDRDVHYKKPLSKLKSLHYRILNILRQMSYNIQYEDIHIKFYYNNLMLGMIITDKVFKYCHFGDFLYSIEVSNDIINRYNSVFNYSDFECRVMFICELILYSGMLYESITITK